MKSRVDLRKEYEAILHIESLKGKSTEDSIQLLGKLIDYSGILNEIPGIIRAIEISEYLRKRNLSNEHLCLIYYFLGNANSIYRQLSYSCKNRIWQWEQEELIDEIINFRMALDLCKSCPIDLEYQCRILTNLANLMDHIGRCVESLDYYDHTLSLNPKFGMALGNKGLCIFNYSKMLYDPGQQKLFLKVAHDYFKEALANDCTKEGIGDFEKHMLWIEYNLKPKYLEEKPDYSCFAMGETSDEIQYREWCLENRLFLNPLNDALPFTISSHDILSTPNLVTKFDEGPYYQGFFSQMKQEFISARFLYYDAIHSKSMHFSDKDTCLLDTLDYPSYSLAIEKVKTSFRIFYSLFDKISSFLNKYLNLGIDPKKISFRNIWYISQKNREGLLTEFKARKNLPLRGLFWLSKDLFENEEGFKKALEPEAKKLNEIRNQLEHKYLKIHSDDWSGNPSSNDNPSNPFFDIRRCDFEEKTLKIMRMARAALIYLSLAIHTEEKSRHCNQKANVHIVPMFLNIYNDDRKV